MKAYKPKFCTHCHGYFQPTSGIQKECASCRPTSAQRYYALHRTARIAKCKEWYKDNKNRASLNKARWKQNNPKNVLASRLKRYGITVEQYENQLSANHYACPICSKPVKVGRGKNCVAVDHCHTTGKFRDLICQLCNAMLGAACEDIATLRRAIKYLEYHNGPDKA